MKKPKPGTSFQMPPGYWNVKSNPNRKKSIFPKHKLITDYKCRIIGDPVRVYGGWNYSMKLDIVATFMQHNLKKALLRYQVNQILKK